MREEGNTASSLLREPSRLRFFAFVFVIGKRLFRHHQCYYRQPPFAQFPPYGPLKFARLSDRNITALGPSEKSEASGESTD